MFSTSSSEILPPCAHTQHEESAVAVFKCAIEAGGNELAFGVIKRSRAFHFFLSDMLHYKNLKSYGI